MPGAVLCAVDEEDEQAARVRRVAGALADALGLRLVTVGPQTEDDGAARVLAAAREQGAELLVAGSHDEGRLRLALAPGLAFELIAHAACPVVVVPPQAHGAGAEGAAGAGAAGAGGSVVCGVDGSPAAAAALAAGARLARALGLRLVAAHVLEPGAGTVVSPQGAVPLESERLLERERRAADELLRRALDGLPEVERREARVVQGPAARELERVAEEEEARLIAVGARAGRLRAALLGSTSRELASGARVPVVVAGPES